MRDKTMENSTTTSSEILDLLLPLWPDLHVLVDEAKQNVDKRPDFSAIRLRGFSEAIVCHLFRCHNMELNNDESQFDRLRLLQQKKIIDRRILGLLHTIRKLGNIAAHGKRSVLTSEILDLVDDARSLAAWFCLYMRPDIDWQARRCFPSEVSENSEENHTIVRPPQTRMSLCDMFEDKLTDDQQKCISALNEFLEDDDQRVFLLKGYAGTGKTFLTGGLAEFLLSQGRMFSLAAPTGRAAKVIAKKTGQSACTIHSLIYDLDDIDMTDQNENDDESATFKVIAKVRNNEDPTNAVVIIDEASLVSNVYSEGEFLRFGSGYLLQDLIAYVSSTLSENIRKIIFVGDPAQLPPVGMSTSPALDAEYLQKNFGLDIANYELTEIVRQKADSSVIRNIIPLRKGIIKGYFSSLSFTFDDDVIRLFKDSVTPLYMKIREKRGAQAPIIVTRSNAETAMFNRAIRAVLFPEMATVAASDKVIVAKNSTIAESNYVVNGEILRIDSVEKTVERRSVQLNRKIGKNGISESVDIALNFRDVTVVLPQSDGDDVVLRAKILDDFLHDDAAILSSDQQRALFVDFILRHKHIDRKKNRNEFLLALRTDPYFNALRLRFGYAITCHKAQGGEWSHVIVSCPIGQNPRSSDYFRWMYTAMTRTSGKLYLVDPPEIRLESVGMEWNTPISTESFPSGEKPKISEYPGKSSIPNEPPIPSVSPQSFFRSWLETEIRNRLANTRIEIEDIAHYQYREAYFFKRDTDSARVDIDYRKNWVVSGVTCPKSDNFANEITVHLTGLSGQQPQVGKESAVIRNTPVRPFLKDFHDRLETALTSRKIRVNSLKEQEWSQRYVLTRGSDSVTVDIYYNGKDQLTKFTPVKPSPNPTSSLVELQNDVMTILSVEIHP